jgi:hypothetical protein
LELTCTPGFDSSQATNWSDWCWKLEGSGKWAEEDIVLKPVSYGGERGREGVKCDIYETMDMQISINLIARASERKEREKSRVRRLSGGRKESRRSMGSTARSKESTFGTEKREPAAF